MINKKWIVLAVIFILLIGIYLSLRLNPPLENSSISYNQYDPYTIAAEIQNNGFTNIKIIEVLINEGNLPEKVELGVSRSNAVTIAEVREPSEGISFHGLREYPIKKSTYRNLDENRHYGLVVNHNDTVNNILVKYSYLGLPFELEIDVSEQINDDYAKNVKMDSFQSNGQTFHLYTFFENVLTYTSHVKANSDFDKKKMYNKYIIEPFNEHTDVGFSYSMLFTDLLTSNNIEQLEKNTLELLDKQEEIHNLITEALKDSSHYLSLKKDTNVYVFPSNDMFTKYQMDGITGQAYFGNNIFVWIDPSFSAEGLKYTVAHEYHHIVNMANNGYRSIANILDHTLTEGKADVFAKMVYPDYHPKWIEPLTEEQEHIALEVLKDIRHLSYENAYEVIKDKNNLQKLPVWADYKIGYRIMNNYIDNNPGITVLDWTNQDSREIVLGSDYSDLMGYDEGR